MIVRPLERPGGVISRGESLQLRSGYVVLNPGRDVGSHSTEDGEEVLVVMEGTAEVSCGRDAKRVEAPAAVLVPAHTVHNVKNVAGGLLRYVYIVSLRGSP